MKTAQRVVRGIIVAEILWMLLACVLTPWRADLPLSVAFRPYVIPLAVAAVLGASLLMSWKLQALLVLATVPAALVLLPLEYALGSPSRRIGRAFQRVSQVPVLRADGTNVFPILAPWDLAYGHRVLRTSHGDALPLTGIANRPTALCQRNDSELVFQSDSLGMRNAGVANRPDIAIIGDSFAQGYCVADSASIPGRLRSQFGSVWNFGVTGAGPVWELGVFREFVARTRPKLIVWTFYEENDLEGIDAEITGFAGRYLDSAFTQHLVDRKAEIDSALLSRLDSLGESFDPGPLDRLKQVLTLREIRSRLSLSVRPPEVTLAKSGAPVEDALPVLRKILSVVRDESSVWGGKVLFVYLPERDRFSPAMQRVPESSVAGHRSAHPKVIALVSSLGIDAIDITSVFDLQKQPLDLFDEGGVHYNELGYRIVSDSIASYITRHSTSGNPVDSGKAGGTHPAPIADRWIRFTPISPNSVVRGLSIR